MSNKREFDSFIIQCAKRYADKHPEEKVTAKMETEIPISSCDYCSGERELYGIPFGTEVKIKDTTLEIFDGSKVKIPIKYCPMCGRQL